MIAAASASAGSLARRSSSEVLPAPRKPASSAVTGWVRPAQRARRSFYLRALFGRRGDDHRRGLGRRLLGLWLGRGGIIGRGGGCRRAVLGGFVGPILGHR